MQPEQVQVIIKDQIAVVDSALKKTQRTFLSGKTKPVSFRITQLLNLKKSLSTMEKDLTDAVKKDIGRDAFITWLSEISIIDKEIDHALSNINKWTSSVCVDTPMFVGPAKSKIIYEPLGVVGIIGSWDFPIYSCLSPLI